MAAKDIEAGRAHVLLRIRNQMNQGLANASKKLKSFGSSVATAGGALAGIGGGALGALGSIAQAFASTTGEIGDMANRTGMARDYLSQIGYAAKITGTDLPTVEKGMQKVSKSLGEAAMGNKQAVAMFESLGLSVSDLMAMSPENRFEKIGKTVAGIKDPALRTAMAMDVFGKSGSSMMDFFAGLDENKSKADQLGITITDSDVRMGEALGDAFDTVTMAMKGIAMQVGAAIAGPLTMLLGVISNVIATISGWVAANRTLFVTLAAGLAIMTAIGGALIFFGTAAMAVGFVISGLIAFFSFLSAAIAFIFSPLGIAIGLFIAAVGAAIYYRDEIIKVVVSVGQWMRKMVDYAAISIDAVAAAFGGLAKALLSGNLALAAQIAFTQMELEITKILNQITGSFMVFLKTLSDKLSDFSGGKINLFSGGDMAKSFGKMGAKENEIQNRLKAMNQVADATYVNPAKTAAIAIDATSIGVQGVMKEAKDFITGIGGDVQTAFKDKGGSLNFGELSPTMLQTGGTKLASRGTFSAAGAGLLATGSDFQQQTAKNTSLMVGLMREQNKKKGAQFN